MKNKQIKKNQTEKNPVGALKAKKIGAILKIVNLNNKKKKKFKKQFSLRLMAYRRWFYFLSLLVILPGLFSLIFWGLKPSIDFTGGSKIEIKNVYDIERAKKFAQENGLEGVSVQRVGDDSVAIRFKTVEESKHNEIKGKIKSFFGENAEELSFDTVGPSISKEITQKAFLAVLFASLIIIFYIGYSFRHVPRPANSWEFGVAAIIALIHDIIVVTGVFSFLGHFYNVEVDPLFVTALLTVIGFSVHDTIVIFDRIRENLIRSGLSNIEEVVEKSVIEMLPRTLNTSFLVWVMLLVLLVFGGTSVRYFVLVLVVGILSGTYSSIFNASPLLITWHKLKTSKRLLMFN